MTASRSVNGDVPLTARAEGTVKVFPLLYALLLVGMGTRLTFPSVREGVYILPVVAAAWLIVTPGVTSFRRRPSVGLLLRYFKLYVGLVLYSAATVLISGSASGRFLKEAAFVIGPIVLVLALMRHGPDADGLRYMKVLFWVTAVSFVWLHRHDLADLLPTPTSLLRAAETSSIATESGHSFVFGLLTLYFTLAGAWLYAALAVAFTLVSFKRIALVGVVGALACYLLLRLLWPKVRNRRFIIPALAVLANVAVVAVYYALARGTFDAFIQAKLGVTTNFLWQGRQRTYRLLFEHLSKAGMIGLGLGGTYDFLIRRPIGAHLAHSDVLKFFLEFGPLLFLVWVFSLYRIGMRRLKILTMTIYMNFLFLTDNVSIYFEVMALFYLIVGFQLASDVSDRQPSSDRRG